MKGFRLLGAALALLIIAVIGAALVERKRLTAFTTWLQHAWTYSAKVKRSAKLLADRGLDADAKARFGRVNAAWVARGHDPLVITSGYRSPEENARVGGAKRSQHLRGLAFDVYVYFLSRQERRALIQLAQAHGFRGFGVGWTTIHMDRGRRRAWGYATSSGGARPPKWARDLFKR
ncbi:MAG: D-Ala-D-Ala carboxypeptidase family metallohydrolase [Pseudomonadota bacterium]